MADEILHNALFLLGGHDLEMCAIRDILSRHRCVYVDRHLSWHNSQLSRYQSDIEQFRLRNPSGWIYHAIDHHNAFSNRPSSLEQILRLFRIPFSRDYQLIAVNDSRYISGLQSAGATPEEIRAIRLADRLAQGVTETDERLAEKAILENLEKCGDLVVVRALSSCFSPICDRLYPYRSLLIYTSEEWVFYGYGVEMVKKIFADEFAKGKLYSGGGSAGYVGAKRWAYVEDEIISIISKIKYGYL